MKPGSKGSLGTFFLGSLFCIGAASPQVAHSQVPYSAPPYFGQAQPGSWRAQHDPWQAQIDAWKAQQDAQNAQAAGSQARITQAESSTWQAPLNCPPAQPAATRPQLAAAQPQPSPAQVQIHSWPSSTEPLAARPYAAHAPVAWRSPDLICERDPGRPGCDGQSRLYPEWQDAQSQSSADAVGAALFGTILNVAVSRAAFRNAFRFNMAPLRVR